MANDIEVVSNNELVDNDSSVEDVNFPFVGQLDELTTCIPYLNTEEGAARANKWEQAIKIDSYYLKGALIFAAIVAVYTFFVSERGKFFNMIGSFIYIGILTGIPYLIYSFTYLAFRKKSYDNGCWEYARSVADDLSQIFDAYYYIFPSCNIFLFSDELCIYTDAINGGVTGFLKSNIKKVNLEHVHLGSTTVSNSTTSGRAHTRINNWGSSSTSYGSTSFSAKTRTVSGTTEQYEWRLDILTDVIDCPNLTVVFPDRAEESAKKAYALLID